jgi:hypothetical protein
MFRQTLRLIGTLLALQFVLGGVAFFLADYRWIAAVVGLAFLVLVALTGWSFAGEVDQSRWRTTLMVLLAGMIWQLPGLQGTVRYLSDTAGWTAYDGITDLQDFLMESWHTVALPLLSAIPPGVVGGYYARYYIALVWLSPCLILMLTAAALLRPLRSAR